MAKIEVSKKDALIAAADGATIATIKRIPVLGELIEGIQKYEENIAEQQRRIFLEVLRDRVDDLETYFTDPWYSTSEAQEFMKKTVASALNAEYTDKVKFFVNMLANAKQDLEQMERLKFVELIRQLSKPALKVLALAAQLSGTIVGLKDIKQIKGNAVSKLNLDGLLVDSCIDELFSVGVLSQQHLKARAGYTAFTQRFVDFLKNPKEDL